MWSILLTEKLRDCIKIPKWIAELIEFRLYFLFSYFCIIAAIFNYSLWIYIFFARVKYQIFYLNFFCSQYCVCGFEIEFNSFFFFLLYWKYNSSSICLSMRSKMMMMISFPWQTSHIHILSLSQSVSQSLSQPVIHSVNVHQITFSNF